MSTLNLDAFVAVPLSIELYGEFARRYPGCVSSVMEQISWDFLDRTTEDFDAAHRGSNGIHWESLFLPEGTEIRTKYFNELKVATIQNKEIVWDGKTYPSMSQLAKSMRGDTSNNAWKVLEVKRPSDAKWQLAAYLRK